MEARMLTTVYLVRHAESIYTPDELSRPISDKAKVDVDRLKEGFESIRLDKVFSSPYRRAIQTVERLALDRNLEVEIVEEIKERRKSLGKLDNFFENVKKLWDDPSYKFDGGESNLEGQARGIKALKRLLVENEGKTIVIGGHGDMMTLILNYYDNVYGYETWRQMDMPDVYKLVFEKNKIVSVERIWDKWII
jgi:2,3-bisphosphoglycerate-dependent phosphoglycerate mutase